MLHWFWQFRRDVNFLEVSRVERLVDDRNNPDSLFWKHDYIIRFQPPWLLPRLERRYMHLGNVSMGSSIDGEATTGSVGQGGRRTAIMLDEFARVPDGHSMLTATADTTSCRIFNSTPNGPGTAFTEVRTSGKVKVLTLGWWDHPEKGKDRRQIEDPTTGKLKWTSPWYEAECARRVSRREIAENLDIDHLASGSLFFDTDVVARHTSAYVRPPDFIGKIDFKQMRRPDEVAEALRHGRVNEIGFARLSNDGPWRFWTNLIDGRPDQTRNYVLGADISNGQGASNSAITVRCVETGEKVAEFADPDTPPHDLARIMVAAALWFGGAKNNGKPLLAWEANGPGGIFGREIVERLSYPFFYHDRQEGTTDHKKTRRYGWHSNRNKKETLLADYRRALARDEIINHSEAALREVGLYIYYENGTIGPSHLVEESDGARSAHGDRVIADALTVMAAREAPKAGAKGPEAPSGSFHSRRLQRRRRQHWDQDRWRR